MTSTTLSYTASRDIKLIRKLTKKIPSQDKSIYHLDYLTQFEQTPSILSDQIILQNVASILTDKLISTPRYRFEYKGPNIILDSIFNCELPENLDTSKLSSYLMIIDPIYATKLDIRELLLVPMPM